MGMLLNKDERYVLEKRIIHPNPMHLSRIAKRFKCSTQEVEQLEKQVRAKISGVYEDPDRLMTATEVAIFLGYNSPKKIYNLLKEQNVPYYKLLRQKRWKKSDIQAMIECSRVEK